MPRAHGAIKHAGRNAATYWTNNASICVKLNIHWKPQFFIFHISLKGVWSVTYWALSYVPLQPLSVRSKIESDLEALGERFAQENIIDKL